jgi:glycosyltransferase involved in cell wall biosynthesis
MVNDHIPLVSFVIPCYNYGRFLSDCLNSILRQKGDYDFEVIVIDDGSTDVTPEILRSFSDLRIRISRHVTNRGHVATVNEGLRQARGAFVARIDPDDRYRPHFLSTVLEKFSAFPDVGLIYGDAAIINEQGEITAECSDRVHGVQDFKGNEFVRLLEENFICAPTVIARREAWQKALPVPEGLAFHDWYFTLMMARQYDFYYVNQVLAEYRVHSENHHGKVVRNKSEEPSIFWLLDCIFSEPEKTRELEGQKQRKKRRIYGVHYLTLADKYFGSHMATDARRCYFRALRYRPGYLLQPAILRRLAATFIGYKAYECLKASARSMLRLRLSR